MMEDFKTEGEATNFLAEHLIHTDENGPGGFCPVIRDNCRFDCICWQPATTREIKRFNDKENSTWRFVPGRCNHPFISGVIEVNT